MNLTPFSVEEENLICIFNTSSRAALIGGISNAISDLDEPKLREVAKSALGKLKSMSDADFSAHIFHPAYDGDDDLEE